ncbi:hypothetical protein [Acaryochloris sp. CCMEE 5410]|uniref:hypothetical protein n=1 Tax=Acaryochloris sp. CCMEE 5410 TaxID=310037 RepID=UPI000248439F|nr:hypothetical protein [Acaryochloris sp. CCMEE 5410]KAI9131360.1 hypothetical protein ON05_027415 [Acaryochloris sp. CCMEE 5410]
MGEGAMQRLWFQFLLVGLCLTACQLQASELPATTQPPDQGKITALQTEFEQEMKMQLAQKDLDDYSFTELSDIALSAAKKVYGANPQLMKQKALFDLQQMTVLDAQILSGYQVKESLNIRDLEKGISGFSPAKSEQVLEDFLPLFYGKTPGDVALRLKQMIYLRHTGPKQVGQRAIISQFIPDRTYRIQASDPPQLAVKTFEEDIFVMTVQVTESGLIKPLQVNWMQPKEVSQK